MSTKKPVRWDVDLENERAMAIYHESADVGKTLAGTKKRIKWKFCYGEDGVEHVVSLTHSIVTGKKVIEMDGDSVCVTQKMDTEFLHVWQAEGHLLRIEIQSLSSFPYTFSIDGTPFERLPQRGFRRRTSNATSSSRNVTESDGMGPAARAASLAKSESKRAPPAAPKPQPEPDLIGGFDGTFDPFAAGSAPADPFSKPLAASSQAKSTGWDAFGEAYPNPTRNPNPKANPSPSFFDPLSDTLPSTNPNPKRAVFDPFDPTPEDKRAALVSDILSEFAGNPGVLMIEDVNSKTESETNASRQQEAWVDPSLVNLNNILDEQPVTKITQLRPGPIAARPMQTPPNVFTMGGAPAGDGAKPMQNGSAAISMMHVEVGMSTRRLSGGSYAPMMPPMAPYGGYGTPAGGVYGAPMGMGMGMGNPNPYATTYPNPYANPNPNPYNNPNPYANPNPYPMGNPNPSPFGNPYSNPNPYSTSTGTGMSTGMGRPSGMAGGNPFANPKSSLDDLDPFSRS